MFGRSTIGQTGRTLLLAALVVVCLAPLAGQSTAAARLVLMTGRVSVLNDGAEWALSLGSVVKPQQMIITGPDGYAQFQVSDGSTFEVFQNARMQFRANPPNWQDLLEVLIGRVKVHIQHWGNIPNHNRVSTPTAVISVRGTVFDVVVEDDDYTTLVSVEEGVVAVRHQHQPGDAKELRAGESIRVFMNQPIAGTQVNHGAVVRALLRAAEQAIYQTVYRTPNGAGGPGSGGSAPGGSSGASGQADKGKATTPGGSAPPPPPPTPPPPPGN